MLAHHQWGLLLHPWNLTWNLKRSPWKRKFLLETIIFRFHVQFRGCNCCSKESQRKASAATALQIFCFVKIHSKIFPQKHHPPKWWFPSGWCEHPMMGWKMMIKNKATWNSKQPGFTWMVQTVISNHFAIRKDSHPPIETLPWYSMDGH